jgi:hypothetical protein
MVDMANGALGLSWSNDAYTMRVRMGTKKFGCGHDKPAKIASKIGTLPDEIRKGHLVQSVDVTANRLVPKDVSKQACSAEQAP